MNKIYKTKGGAEFPPGKLLNRTRDNGFIGLKSLSKAFTQLMIVTLLLCGFVAKAQTTLIDPATDGGFNSGATFAANGWTVSNSANNPWLIGTGVTSGAITGNSAYVSTNGTSNTYSNGNAAVNYFYRDITVPAGETKIKLSFNWINNGETDPYDVIQVFVAPTSITPAGTTTSAGIATTTPVPPGIAGATSVFLSGTLQTATQTATVYLPGNLAGTTFRLIFSWRNDGSGGSNPPGVVDNISLISQVPGIFTSIASGNYTAAATWDANAVPSPADNIVVSTGHTVTIDAAGQGAYNASVNGILTYGTSPTSFSIAGNLTVNAGGAVNVFNGTTGKTLNVAGNIQNDGSIDISVGSATGGLLVLNGSTVQTVSGTGSFVNNKIRSLTFSNTSTAIPNINWLVNNIGVEYNLNITNAKINLGTNKFTYGTSATLTGNSFDFTNGGFMAGGKFSRWWTTGATGYNTASPATIPTGQAGRYPFYTATGAQRIFYLGRTTPTAGGQYAVTYNDAAGMTTGLSIADGAYTVTDRWNGNFVVTTEGTSPAAATYWVTTFVPNAFIPANGNTRIMLQNAAISGTHVAGTTIPSAQRSGVTLADLTSATGIYMGINNADIPFIPVANGNWNDAATWNKGSVPGCNDAVTIGTGFTVTVNSSANTVKGLTVNAGGTLVVASGDLTIGCTLRNNSFVNNGTLTVTGGTLNVNGSMLHTAGSTFNQSGGDINVDGNDGGAAATSVASGTSIVQINTQFVNFTGGRLTVVDPHANSTASNAFTYTNSIANVNVTAGHTLRFGDGVSTDAGGNITNGFRLATFPGSNRISFYNVEINGGSGTNRYVTSANSYGINGNLTINANSEYRDAGVTTHINGDVVNNGTYVATGTLAFDSFINGTAVASTNAQTVSGTGTFNNAVTSPTARLTSITVNNTSTGGVTLSFPLSVSGTLTLTAGKVNTTNANLLTVGTATAAGTITGGSATAYVNGPLARTIASGNANTNFILFPVGKTAYAPLQLAPATTAVTVMKAEAFDTNAGTVDASILNLSTGRRWEAPIVSGTVTSINVRLADANLVATNIPVAAPSAAGIYTATFGSVATFAANTPPALPTVTANAAIPFAGYTGFLSFADSNACAGTPNPGNTIASVNNICAGTPVTLSVQNATTGAGVSYQWQSSTDGVSYTDVATATGTTLTVTPAAATYYQLKVTCASGPATGTSTPVQVVFSTAITGTTPAARCGAGTVTLGATGTTSNIAWYDVPAGGNIIGTGATFTTPSIAATTTYYAAAQVSPEVTATIGTGTTLTGATSQPSAFVNRWPNYWSQTIYTAAELQAAGITAGNINSMAYNISTLGDGATNSDFTVRIATTSSSTFASTSFQTTGFTTVYGPQTYTHTASGWQTINFSTAFNWDGVSNIVVEVKMNGADATNNSQTYYTATAGNTVLWVNSFTGSTTTGTTSVNRLNIRFGQGGCSSARVPVIATVNTPPALTLSANAVTICNGSSSSAVTVATGASDYDTYAWTPAAGVTGDAATGWVFNPSVSTTYTLNASQSGGTMCVATPVTVAVTVNATPAAITIAPVAGSACLNNIVTLNATGGAVNVQGTVGQATTLTGNTDQQTAFNNRFSNYWSQTIYTAAELNALGIYAGKINAMACEVATLGDGATNTAFTVKMGSTVASNFANTTFLPTTTGFTTVYGPQTYTHTASGWQTITFTTPYEWDGVSNIVINVTMNGANLTNNAQTYFTATTDDTMLTAVGFSGTTTTGTLSKKRLNVRFSATNNSAITWSPATNLYTDAAATVPYVGGTGAATVYVKSATAGTTVYTATSSTAQNCSSSQTVSVVYEDCSIGFGNLQFPATITLDNPCDSETVYGRVWKNGVTEAAGQAPGMQAWLGISTANTDPSTWAAADWHAATFNVQTGNDDEFMYNVTGVPAGTYYYAYRYQYQSGPMYYGGLTGEWTAGNSGVLTVNATTTPTVAAAQNFCGSATVANLSPSGSDIKWYADATGGTALDGTTALVNGENYFATKTVNGCESARVETTVTITTLTIADPADVSACGSYTLPTLATGNYYTATNGGGTLLAAGTVITSNQTVFVYAQSGTTPNCTAEQSFTITINNIEVDAPADVTVCGSYILPVLTVGNYYTAPNGGGTQLAPGTVITSTQDIYVFGETGTTPNCTDENVFTVTVTAFPALADPADVTVCTSYTLPSLAVGSYYTGTGGTGTMLNAGDVINTNLTIYVFAESGTIPNCTSEESFTVTISAFTIADPADISVCNSYTLPALATGNYFTAPNGGGTQLAAGTVLTANQTVYIYAESGTTPNCTAEQNFVLTVVTIAAPTGAAQQTISAPTAEEATIEDIVTNETGVIWFASEADAIAGTPALAAGTQVFANTTYWGILTDGICRSTPLAVLVTEVLGDRGFDLAAFSYYPNPVKDVLKMSYSSDITSVSVYNMIGQQVIGREINATEASIDMSSLADGTYIVNVTAGNNVKTIKVVKKQ